MQEESKQINQQHLNYQFFRDTFKNCYLTSNLEYGNVHLEFNIKIGKSIQKLLHYFSKLPITETFYNKNIEILNVKIIPLLIELKFTFATTILQPLDMLILGNLSQFIHLYICSLYLNQQCQQLLEQNEDLQKYSFLLYLIQKLKTDILYKLKSIYQNISSKNREAKLLEYLKQFQQFSVHDSVQSLKNFPSKKARKYLLKSISSQITNITLGQYFNLAQIGAVYPHSFNRQLLDYVEIFSILDQEFYQYLHDKYDVTLKTLQKFKEVSHISVIDPFIAIWLNWFPNKCQVLLQQINNILPKAQFKLLQDNKGPLINYRISLQQSLLSSFHFQTPDKIIPQLELQDRKNEIQKQKQQDKYNEIVANATISIIQSINNATTPILITPKQLSIQRTHKYIFGRPSMLLNCWKYQNQIAQDCYIIFSNSSPLKQLYFDNFHFLLNCLSETTINFVQTQGVGDDIYLLLKPNVPYRLSQGDQIYIFQNKLCKDLLRLKQYIKVEINSINTKQSNKEHQKHGVDIRDFYMYQGMLANEQPNMKYRIKLIKNYMQQNESDDDLIFIGSDTDPDVIQVKKFFQNQSRNEEEMSLYQQYKGEQQEVRIENQKVRLCDVKINQGQYYVRSLFNYAYLSVKRCGKKKQKLFDQISLQVGEQYIFYMNNVHISIDLKKLI